MTGLYTMGYLGLVPILTPLICSWYNLDHYQGMFAASITASLFAITLSNPFDTIKTNLQGDLGILIRKKKVSRNGKCV